MSLQPVAFRLIQLIALVILLFSATGSPPQAGAFSLPQSSPMCRRLGWFPTMFGLKDHHIFLYNGFYYLISIYRPNNNPDRQDRFAYARSADLCHWERIGNVLPLRVRGRPDEMNIWAPFVYDENGVFYLYYTGVDNHFTQRIMLATTTNPSNPASWNSQGVVFQPGHLKTNWRGGSWADCRDPSVFRIGKRYYMYYTGQDKGGGIVGLAKARSPRGPWRDKGPITPPDPTGIPESPTLIKFNGIYYLFYHHTSNGQQYRRSSTPIGPWSPPINFRPGWAHEFWQGIDDEWYTSYLTGYTVTITPFNPTYIGAVSTPLFEKQHKIYIPIFLNKRYWKTKL